MKLWRREPTPEEELDDRRANAAVTLQRWTRGIKWRRTHAKDVRALDALRRFQQTTRAREAALVEVTPLRRSAGLVASAVGAAAGFVASSGRYHDRRRDGRVARGVHRAAGRERAA